MLGELLRSGSAIDDGKLLECANANHAAVACFRIPDFRPGLYTLDPHDIKKFGDEEEEFDYGDETGECDPGGDAPSFPFAAVDSGALIVADVGQLSRLVRLLTWEQYDLGLQDEAVFGKMVDALGGPYFAVIYGGCMPGMEFDGDGTYTIPVGCLSRVRG